MLDVGGALAGLDRPRQEVVSACTVDEACTWIASANECWVLAVVSARAVGESDIIRLVETAAHAATAGFAVLVAEYAPQHHLLRIAPNAAPAQVNRQPSFGPNRSLAGASIDGWGPDTPAREAARKLVEPTELLFLDGPCGGEHLGLGNLALCRVGDPVAVPADGAVMPCFHGAACAVMRPGLERVNTAALRATRIVSMTCSGLRLSKLPLYPDLNPGTGLIANPATDAVLTSIGHVRDGDPEIVAAYYLVNTGMPFGAVANALARMRLTRGADGNVVCVGNPFSRIAPTIVDAAVIERADCLAIQSPPTSAPFKDLRATLVGASADQVVVDLDGACTGGVLVGDTLYLTVPGATLEVVVMLVARAQLEGPPRALYLDLQGMANLIARWPASNAASTAFEVLSECLELLDLWPTADLVPGTIVARSVIDGAHALFEDALARAHQQLMAAYLESVLGRGSTIPISGLLAASHRLERCLASEHACPACESSVDDHLYRRRTGEATRTLGVCRACGPIYDGAGGIARWAEAPAVWVTETTLAVKIAVTNPYPSLMPCSGGVVLRGYDEHETLGLHVMNRAIVAPGTTEILHFELALPATMLPGVHMLGALVVIGGQMVGLRRIIRVATCTMGSSA